MDINFNKEHISTLVKLHAIAEKHGHHIQMSISSDEFEACIDDLLNINNLFSSKILKEYDLLILKQWNELIDFDKIFNFQSSMVITNSVNFWLTNFQRNKVKSDWHSMHYNNTTLNITLQDDWECNLSEEIDNKEIQENEIELIDWISNHTHDCGSMIVFSDSPTIIKGFNNKEPIQDYRVYREGMALKFFGDLICEYLDEPLIKETY